MYVEFINYGSFRNTGYEGHDTVFLRIQLASYVRTFVV